jgi:hypothetical protein
VSDTPRTDALIGPHEHKDTRSLTAYFLRDLVEHARQLERELRTYHLNNLEVLKARQRAELDPFFVQFDCHFNGDFAKCDKDCAQLKVCKRRT